VDTPVDGDDFPQPPVFGPEITDRQNDHGDPAASDLVFIRKAAVFTFVALAALSFTLWRQPSGADVWVWLEFPALMALLGGTVALFAFGLLAAMRRGAYWMVALGVVLTPLAFFVWAEVLRHAESGQATGVEPTDEPSWFERSD
jgi:hypothetical protein